MNTLQYWLILLLLSPAVAYCDFQMFRGHWKQHGYFSIRWQDYIPIVVFEFAFFAAGYIAGGVAAGGFQ